MDEKILEEIMKECKNWRERVLIRLFPKMFVKVYHIGRRNGINYIIKK